jgi:hypothetical protein
MDNLMHETSNGTRLDPAQCDVVRQTLANSF